MLRGTVVLLLALHIILLEWKGHPEIE